MKDEGCEATGLSTIWRSSNRRCSGKHSRLRARVAAEIISPYVAFLSWTCYKNSMANEVISFERAVPQFTVPDLVRTGEYYRDVLGFQIAGYWDGEQVTFSPETPPVFAIVRRDSVEVFFSRADQSEVRSRPTGGAPDVYLRVIGIDALAEELRARGAEILDGPEDRVYGQRELVVMDCNGLILCFGKDTRAPAPLNNTLDVRKVGTNE
jgi:catechol 2,3-dioxygenase-like lactoylglutathione lyase family enzyme